MSLSKILRQYADSLAPNKGMEKKAKEITKKIQDVFHENAEEKNYSVARVVPHGSFAKKTSIWLNMDLDIVIVLNEDINRLNIIKDEMHEVLQRELDENCENGQHALKLHVDDIKVDVMLAANYVNSMHGENGWRTAEVQVKNVLADMKGRRDLSYEAKKKLSTASLSEGAVVFEKKHSAFSHALSRLAKFWSMTIGIPGFNRGRSSIMEYLGARAAELEEINEEPDFLRGLRCFLEMIESSDDLEIIWTLFYDKSDIPRQILRNRPFLLDPTSPYDNLLEGERRDYLKQMSPFASETLQRLRAAELLDLKRIFDPQPRLNIIHRRVQVTPRDYIIGSRCKSQLYPTVKNRCGVKGDGFEITKSYYFTFIDVAATDAYRTSVVPEEVASSSEESEREDEEESIAEEVKPEFEQFVSPGHWSPSNESHSSRGTTFTVPVGKGSNKVILISADWEKLQTSKLDFFCC